MSLHDDHPLDLKEQRALGAALAIPEADRWWAGLPDNTRRAIMQKLLAALAKAEAPRDIGSLTRSLMKADELDLKRTQRPPGVTHNTQVNIDARGNQELVAELKKQLTLAEREKLLEKLESGTGGNGNGKH